MFLHSRETFISMILMICSIPVLTLLVYAFWHRLWMHLVSFLAPFSIFGVSEFGMTLGFDIFSLFIGIESKMDPEMHTNR